MSGARAATVVALALGAMAASSCAKPLADLEPFPCAGDGSCPGGRACVADVGCVAPVEDAPCVAGVTDCAAVSDGHVCGAGICTRACKNDSECGAGRVCASPAGVDGFCLPDCTVGQSCGAGLSCLPLWRGGLSGCFGPGFHVASCKEAEGEFTCNEACGGHVLNEVVDCGNNSFCTASSSCDAGRCNCNDGQAQTCSGTPCDGSNCNDGSWWCAPNGSGLISCDAQLARWGGECRCWNGAILKATCGTPYTCEQLCSDECDVVKQDCPDPARPKCAEVVDPAGFSTNRCVAVTGDKEQGEPCSRRGNAVSDIGHDDCARGFYCSLSAVNPNGFTCRQHCNASSGSCPEDTQCILGYRVADASSSTSLCRETCDPFGSEGCPAGVGCKPGGTSGYCSVIGSAQPGEPCRASNECAGNATCTRAGICVTPCDATHPCPEGMTCDVPSTGSIGVCETGI